MPSQSSDLCVIINDYDDYVLIFAGVLILFNIYAY